MTIYAGETVLIAHTATDFNGSAVTNTDVTDVSVTIYNVAGDVMATSTMVWVAERERWEYQWDTTAVDAGSYRAKVTLTASGDVEAWEYKRIRLAKNPV